MYQILSLREILYLPHIWLMIQIAYLLKIQFISKIPVFMLNSLNATIQSNRKNMAINLVPNPTRMSLFFIAAMWTSLVSCKTSSDVSYQEASTKSEMIDYVKSCLSEEENHVLNMRDEGINDGLYDHKAKYSNDVDYMDGFKDGKVRREKVLALVEKFSWRGLVIWEGIDDLFEFSIDSVSQEKLDIYESQGLEFLKSDVIKNVPSIYCENVLANYYATNKDFKKSTFWAIKGAERGHPQCIRLLIDAYYLGNRGLVKDLEEGIKWTYLGAAAGDEWSQDWINTYEVKCMMIKEIAPSLIEGKRRAIAWMTSHPGIFTSSE